MTNQIPDPTTIIEDFEEITAVRRIGPRPKKLAYNTEGFQCPYCRSVLRVITVADLENPLREEITDEVVAYICDNPTCLEETC